MATREEFARIMKGLTILYPRFKASQDDKACQAMLEMYYRILGDLPGELLDAAALEVGRTNTFFPSAAELRKAAMALLERSEGVPSKEDAWAEISRSFSSHGYYRGSPEWSHGLIRAAIDAMGGYTALCTSDNPVADRAHFFKIYEALLGRARDDMAMLPAVREVIARLSAGNGHKRLESGQ